MSIFRDVDIMWRGKSYTVTPSNRLLRRIEAGGISISGMMNGIATGQPQVSHLAYLIFVLLNSAGAKTTEDEIMGDLTNGKPEDVEDLMIAALTAVSPAEPDPKKPKARPEISTEDRAKKKAAKKAAKKARRKTQRK